MHQFNARVQQNKKDGISRTEAAQHALRRGNTNAVLEVYGMKFDHVYASKLNAGEYKLFSNTNRIRIVTMEYRIECRIFIYIQQDYLF